jgi:hypothetical protein
MKQIFIFACLLMISCKPEPEDAPPCVNGDCKSTYYISDTIPDVNNYWHIRFKGKNYFQIKGKLSNLSNEYYINGVPLVETQYDSDYWVIFDTIQWRVPLYTPFSLYRDRRFTDPIPIGDTTFTLYNIAKILFPPLNIAGYTLPANFNPDNYMHSLYLKTRSAYSMNPVQNIFLHSGMRGDTANIYITAQFNNDLGRREERYHIIKVIFD